MSTQTRSPFETSLHSAASQLVERSAAFPAEAGRPQVLRWLLAIGALFVAWHMWRGVKPFLWALFGLAAVRWFLGG
jgi:hypothetical protein